MKVPLYILYIYISVLSISILLGKAYMFIGDLRNAEHYYKLSIKAKADHLPVIINYSQFLIQQVRCSLW